MSLFNLRHPRDFAQGTLKIYGCAHIFFVSDVLSFRLFHINPGLALVEEKHAWKKLNIDEKYAATNVVHVAMSRNITTVWVLTWLPKLPYNYGQGGKWRKKTSEETSARPFVSLNSRCSSMTMTREWDRTATLRRWWCSHPPILWSRRCHAVAACMFVSWSSKIDSACFGKINTRKKTKKYRCKIRRDNIRR